jgi:hypothetical protein
VAIELTQLLSQFGQASQSIFLEECRSLVSEAMADLPKAIKHRQNEIRLIHRLHRLSMNTDGEQFVFGQYDFADIRDRMVLLAMLYRGSADLAKAIGALIECGMFCVRHGIAFDAKSLLEEYVGETTIKCDFALEVSENGQYRARKRPKPSPAAFTDTPTSKLASNGSIRENRPVRVEPSKIAVPLTTEMPVDPQAWPNLPRHKRAPAKAC